MKKADSMLLKAFLYGLPAIIIFAVFSYSYTPEIINHAGRHVRLLYNFGGIVLAAWMTLAIYLSVRLMVSRPFRDKVLTKLTFIRERDEREVILTGKAARTTFLTSLAILIFFFCVSSFQVSIYRVSPQEAIDGKTGRITLGFGFHLMESSQPKDKTDHIIKKQHIFSHTGLPVSSPTLILVLIVWQIISYNYSMWRLTK
jgi:hypothetical protein